MSLSKTTLNFATARNVDLTMIDESVLWVTINADEDEPDFAYNVREDGSFTWNCNFCLPRMISEELPYFVRDEKHLREVLKFISE